MNHGERAYAHYCKWTDGKSLVTGDPLPTWGDLRPTIQEAWRYTERSIRHDSLCWIEKPGAFLACDRAKNHKGKHSWEHDDET